MGVKRLKTYIENSNNHYLRFLQFRNSHLIIDGCNLLYVLHVDCKLDQMHGGDYDVFEDVITEFFQNLKDCDIHPFVVLDGGSDHTDKKFETLKTRHLDKIQQANMLSTNQRGTVYPLLIKNVWRQTLQKLSVPLVQCIEEADWEIAALAKQWNCPVLSNDSDFYIFDLPAGIIPIQNFEWRNIREDRLKNKYIPAKHFTVERFCASFNNMNRELLPLFACILGNDYVKLQNVTDIECKVRSICGGDVEIDRLLKWLSSFQKPEAAAEDLLNVITDRRERDVTRETLFKGMREYKLTSGYLAQFFHSEVLPSPAFTEALRALPAWTLRPLLEAKMSPNIIDVLLLRKMFMRPQVEDFSLSSSSQVSRPIRQLLYGLLLLGKEQTVSGAEGSSDMCYVTEYDREELLVISIKVKATETSVIKGLKLETLHQEPHSLRLQVLLDTLGVPSAPVRGVPLHLQLQVFVTRYWLVNAQPQPSLLHLWALLLGMVYGTCRTESNTHTDTLFQLRKLLSGRGRIVLDHEAAHLYSQWQSCLAWSLCLNSLLCHPLPDPQCSRLYRGTLVHQVVAELKRGITPESLLLRDSSAQQLFQQLRKAVLSLMDEDVIRGIRTGYEHRTDRKTQTNNRSKNESDDLSSLFEHLMYEDIEDYDEDLISGNRKKTKDETSDKFECSYNVRTRHKVKARTSDHPSKKSERRCFE